jgi:diphosphomevalonate decarboxylase
MSRRSSEATAVAHPNIALVKYWGKRDETLILPHQSSLSLTIAPLHVRTTVTVGAEHSEVVLHGRPAVGEPLRRVLDMAAQLTNEPVRVISGGNFPMAAGLASSAAGFAALAVALRAALGLPADAREASRLARRGSGSACRSIEGGFCVWRRGQRDDGEDSFAEQVASAEHWPALRMVVAVVRRTEKAVSSRDGMRLTVETSPFYRAWCEAAEADISVAEDAIRRRDLPSLGALAEKNAWRMHATALGADPPLCYLLPETLRVLDAVATARAGGVPVWFTLDAGPNPVLLTDAENVVPVRATLDALGIREIHVCQPGAGTRLEPPSL